MLGIFRFMWVYARSPRGLIWQAAIGTAPITLLALEGLPVILIGTLALFFPAEADDNRNMVIRIAAVLPLYAGVCALTVLWRHVYALTFRCPGPSRLELILSLFLGTYGFIAIFHDAQVPLAWWGFFGLPLWLFVLRLALVRQPWE
jgi:hypothetical protein